jgi:glycosyltransferase involved in cell wall biosynthesis
VLNQNPVLAERKSEVQDRKRSIRVLYSFPHKLGAARICTTAWHEIDGIAEAGADVLVYPGALARPVRPGVRVRSTLSRGRIRIPYRVLGTRRACALHDLIVARRLRSLAGKIDIVHLWPLGALMTIRVAKSLGIKTVLERPNAHTRFAYAAVRQECDRLGITMPRGHEHEHNEDVLEREEREYALADYLLCPSDFVANSFSDLGFSVEKLKRHQYGYDDAIFKPKPSRPRGEFRMLFAGGCAPRKGLHYALEAWLRSPAREGGTFSICGDFIPGYAEKLSPMLSDSSVKRLGFRKDVAELMRDNDVLVLPSIEEGSALVTLEARGSGCVLLVSDAAGAVCRHNENALVHRAGDVETLTEHIGMLYKDRALLERLRAASLASAHEITWSAAGVKLVRVYQDALGH